MRTSLNIDARAERRALIAIFAVFALIVQAFVPASAMAASSLDAAAQICTGHGVSAPTDTAPAKDTAGHACQHCVCPVPAALPAPALPTGAVVMAHAATSFRAAFVAPRPPARAPPRPPGQGPPTSNA